MSETEHHFGKLKPTGKSIVMYLALDEGFMEKSDSYDAKEYFEDKYYNQAVVIDGLVFEVEYEPHEEYEDIFRAAKNADGSINFQVKYYNGGCCFSEAIEIALDNLK